LLDPLQKVNILNTVEKFVQFEFGNGKKLLEYQDNYMHLSMCANHVQFELYYDTGLQDVDHIVPFLFVSEIRFETRKKEMTTFMTRFKPYLAFIDIGKYQEEEAAIEG
jgi:hypothetical protein